jgi:hypothetical protein
VGSGFKQWWAKHGVVAVFIGILFTSILLLCLVHLGAITAPWDQVANIVAKTILVGGAGTMLLKVFQIGGVFRKELEDIIYDEKFTSLRSDRVKVWANFTRALYAERFPGLSKTLSVEDMKSVLPTDRQFYLCETSRQIKIERDPTRPTWILVRQESSSILVTESGCAEVVREKEFKFEPAAMSNDPDELKKMIDARCAKFWKIKKGAGKGVKRDTPPDAIDQVGKTKQVDGRSVVPYTAALQGDTSYYVEDSAESAQNLALDNTIAVVTMSYLVGLEVAVRFDEAHFVVQFHEIGGARFFDVKPDHGPIHKKTNQVLFSDSGFFLTVQRKS